MSLKNSVQHGQAFRNRPYFISINLLLFFLSETFKQPTGTHEQIKKRIFLSQLTFCCSSCTSADTLGGSNLSTRIVFFGTQDIREPLCIHDGSIRADRVYLEEPAEKKTSTTVIQLLPRPGLRTGCQLTREGSRWPR